TDHFFGMLSGGQMDEPTLLSILRRLPEGDSEIMVHPGELDADLAAKYSWGYHWEDELQALCSDRATAAVQQQKIQLISYREL
ncbi:MAG TPA: ChbG/HpnK family deacetylase, partial [Negativicutes bacterium]|nr:ChbG/HpnK family deacetylase [Negativicutes bacterium]